jgi:serpin B
MKVVLGDSFSGGTYHSAANRLARELASRALDQSFGSEVRKIDLNLADAIFIERTREIEPAFLDLLAREYDSGVQRVDFRNAFDAARMTINDWVAAQTHNKILDLLPASSVDAKTPDVLVNALYFFGSWRVPFMREATRPADFYSLAGDTHQVDTMFDHELQAGYASSVDYSLASLSYVGDHLSMVILLPAHGKFESVRSTISAAWLKEQLAKLDTKPLSVALPKFKMTVGSFSLKAALNALGMKQAFSDSADFSGIAPNLAIADVLQKCFIAVNEDGTEAAAATSSIMRPNSASIEQTIPFVVDRPFLFFVRDDSGAILFSGQVMDPAEE